MRPQSGPRRHGERELEPRRHEEHEGEQGKRVHETIPLRVEDAGRQVIDAAVAVHRELGPGLLESAYQRCLEYELGQRGVRVQCEVPLPIRYKDAQIEVGYRIDMLVEDSVVVENKAIEALLPIHTAQLLTYLKLSNLRLGFLLNWNSSLLKDGLKRIVR